MAQLELTKSAHLKTFIQNLIENAAHSPADIFRTFLDETGNKKALNLGCGATKIPGALGVDIVQNNAVDLVHDLK